MKQPPLAIPLKGSTTITFSLLGSVDGIKLTGFKSSVDVEILRGKPTYENVLKAPFLNAIDIYMVSSVAQKNYKTKELHTIYFI